MEDYIEEALATGYIRPSTSSAAAGYFFVEEKDGGLQPYISYRGLNTTTIWTPKGQKETPIDPNEPFIVEELKNYVKSCTGQVWAQSKSCCQLPARLLEPAGASVPMTIPLWRLYHRSPMFQGLQHRSGNHSLRPAV